MIVNLKQVQCSKAGCSNLFWIDETWEGLYWCSEECHGMEAEGLEGVPTTAAAAEAAAASDAVATAAAAAIAATDKLTECLSTRLNLERGTDEPETTRIPTDVAGVNPGRSPVSNSCTGGPGIVG